MARRALLVAGLSWTLGVLLVDATATKAVQHALGAATFAFLVACGRLSSRRERREMWFVLASSTAIEVLATQLWGLYHYRFGNVPLYVPPGHGLIFLFANHAARTRLVERHGALLVRLTLATAVLWAAAGVLLEHDVHGACYIPGFVWLLLVAKEAPAYAATFVIASIIELVGVRLGTWHWAREMPGLGFPSADPPSAVAAGYCWFGFWGLALARWTLRKRSGAPVTGAPLAELVDEATG